ncbi:hypothetical protein SBRY_50846 [Actinacidiphila bryophytorum]|uniref:Uncharacterized protein n=1 Tax=Actinacidiphila bryophytorum TaxID=1436133 RepID=A0A9W4MIY7_9ACTN|nr:hypothetical protein SBRY_50846 [Actinacidiphila bryophytorum]
MRGRRGSQGGLPRRRSRVVVRWGLSAGLAGQGEGGCGPAGACGVAEGGAGARAQLAVVRGVLGRGLTVRTALDRVPQAGDRVTRRLRPRHRPPRDRSRTGVLDRHLALVPTRPRIHRAIRRRATRTRTTRRTRRRTRRGTRGRARARTRRGTGARTRGSTRRGTGAGAGRRTRRRTARRVAAAAERGENGVVGRLLLVVAVEQQRGVTAAPAVLVGDAPHRDAGAAGHGQAALDDGGVAVGLRGAGARDVHLGHLHVDTEVGEALQVGLEVGRDRGLGVEVPLEAHAVDRDAAGLEVLDHVVDGGALRVDAVGVVVVVAELGVRVGGPRGAEGLLDVAVADLVLEGRAAAGAGTAVLEGLVDDVPRVDLALVVGHDLGDVVVHRRLERRGAQARHPAGQLLVPDQRVPADQHVLRLGVGDDLVAGTEVERVLARLDRVPLHLVLGRDRAELGVQGRRVGGLAEVGRADRGTEVAALRRRRVAQGADRVGGAGGRHQADGRHCTCRARGDGDPQTGATPPARLAAVSGGVTDHFQPLLPLLLAVRVSTRCTGPNGWGSIREGGDSHGSCAAGAAWPGGGDSLASVDPGLRNVNDCFPILSETTGRLQSAFDRVSDSVVMPACGRFSGGGARVAVRSCRSDRSLWDIAGCIDSVTLRPYGARNIRARVEIFRKVIGRPRPCTAQAGEGASAGAAPPRKDTPCPPHERRAAAPPPAPVMAAAGSASPRC